METTWIVEKPDEGKRIDKVIAERNEAWSRSTVQEWIRQGFVSINGEVITKGNVRLKQGETIRLDLPPIPEKKIEAAPMSLDIRYEDRDLLVVNKPRGLVVHPAPGNWSGTLVNGLLDYCKDELSSLGGALRPGIVHRIDKDTSGLLIVAKNNVIHQALTLQLKTHQIERNYTAIVDGCLPHPSGTIRAPIARDAIHRKRMKVDSLRGKEAITHFRVVQRFPHHTLIHCQLETGRTHQIRVHLQYIGYPIVGDPIYGRKKSQKWIQGQALHAHALRFRHPRTQRWIEVEAEYPEELERLIARLSLEWM